jgi:type I restriction enzyme S subunit
MQIECFSDAPATWKMGPIGRLAVVNPRYPIAKGVEYPFVSMAGIGENFGGILSIGRRAADSSGLSRFRNDDTLFAKITPCPENGKVAFVHGLQDDIGLGSTEFIVLQPRHGTDPRYLFHLVSSHAVRGHAIARMEGSTGRQRVPDEVFTRSLLVPLPPYDEQAAIGEFLDALDTLRDQIRSVGHRAQLARRALMRDLLPRWIGLRKIAAEEGDPDVIETVAAREVAHVGNGATPSRDELRYWRDGSIPWLMTGKVHERIIQEASEHVTEAALRECSIRLVPAASVLVAMIGQGRTRGMSALLAIDACINQNFAAFTPKSRPVRRVDGPWLFYYLDYHYPRVRDMGGGTNQGALNCHLLKRLRLPLPRLERQEEVAAVLCAAEEQEQAYRSVLTRVETLKKCLAAELLSGRVRLSTLTAAAS